MALIIYTCPQEKENKKKVKFLNVAACWEDVCELTQIPLHMKGYEYL